MENSVLAGMLASVDAHNYELIWSTCAQHGTGTGGLEACWGCTVSTEPTEPWPGMDTLVVCLRSVPVSFVYLWASHVPCVYLSPPSPTHNWLSAV